MGSFVFVLFSIHAMAKNLMEFVKNAKISDSDTLLNSQNYIPYIDQMVFNALRSDFKKFV